MPFKLKIIKTKYMIKVMESMVYPMYLIDIIL